MSNPSHVSNPSHTPNSPQICASQPKCVGLLMLTNNRVIVEPHCFDQMTRSHNKTTLWTIARQSKLEIVALGAIQIIKLIPSRVTITTPSMCTVSASSSTSNREWCRWTVLRVETKYGIVHSFEVLRLRKTRLLIKIWTNESTFCRLGMFAKSVCNVSL